MDTLDSTKEKTTLVEVIRLETAEKFLESIRPDLSRINPLDYTDSRVYRGHYNAEWELLPAAWRKNTAGQNKLDPLKELLAQRVRDEMSRHPLVSNWVEDFREKRFRESLQIVTEVFAVRQFCDLADELGLLIPQQGEILNLEDSISRVIHTSTNGIYLSRFRLLFQGIS